MSDLDRTFCLFFQNVWIRSSSLAKRGRWPRPNQSAYSIPLVQDAIPLEMGIWPNVFQKDWVLGCWDFIKRKPFFKVGVAEIMGHKLGVAMCPRKTSENEEWSQHSGESNLKGYREMFPCWHCLGPWSIYIWILTIIIFCLKVNLNQVPIWNHRNIEKL